MRWILILILALSHTIASASSSPDLISCIQAKNDPYDPNKKMPWGKYSGQCADTSVKRPAVILSEDDTSITFANFRHLDQFWIARVPKAGVAQIIFRIDRFSSGIPYLTPSHTLLEFIMLPGNEIQLTPQVISPSVPPSSESSAATVPSSEPSPTPSASAQASSSASTPAAAVQPILVSDFYFSVDYVAPKGVDYGLFQGLVSTYLTVERFISASDLDSGAKDPNYPIEKRALALDEPSMETVLENAIQRSNDRSLDYTYDTFNYNCTTELFNLLDDSLSYGGRDIPRFKESLLHPRDPVAGPSIKALKIRDLIARDGKDDPDYFE